MRRAELLDCLLVLRQPRQDGEAELITRHSLREAERREEPLVLVADDNATEVTVRSVTIDGTPTGLVEITAATIVARPEVPGRFYAAVVDSGHCFYQVDGAKMWAPNQVIRPTGRIETDPCGIDPTQLLPPSTVAAN